MPASPRKRRRLGWIAIAITVAVAGGATILALPEAAPPPPETFSNRPADIYVPEKPLKLDGAARAAIADTLESFVLNGLGRRDVMAAYRLATPDLRAGVTLAEWQRGELPVFPYDARPGNGRQWTKDYAFGDTVGFELFLQPGPRERGARIAFKGAVRRIGGRWLVDSIVPAATFSRDGEKARVVANTDFQRGELGAGSDRGRLSATWLLIPATLLGLGVAIPVLLFAYRGLRRA